MANARGRQQVADDGTLLEKIVPSSAWTDDSNCHYLLVDLPGFKKEELKLEIDGHGHVFVSGKKQGSDGKIVHFEQTFTVPENTEREKIIARFESEILYIIVPKKVKNEEREGHNRIANGVEEKHKHDQDQQQQQQQYEGIANSVEKTRKHDWKQRQKQQKIAQNRGMIEEEGLRGATRETANQEAGLFERVVEILSKNKGIVATAILSFLLGVLVCQKSQSNT